MNHINIERAIAVELNLAESELASVAARLAKIDALADDAFIGAGLKHVKWFRGCHIHRCRHWHYHRYPSHAWKAARPPYCRMG